MAAGVEQKLTTVFNLSGFSLSPQEILGRVAYESALGDNYR